MKPLIRVPRAANDLKGRIGAGAESGAEPP